ncbi:MAG: ferritin family protein [Nitrospirota bacterium]
MNDITMVIQMEQESVDFYTKCAEKTDNALGKKMFLSIAEDEEEHFNIFQNPHSFISDTGNWFMWEEQGIIEG